ncbi:putative mediator of RNA polymerase II transcription subunit 29 isoform X3 [Teleopsis dalmanni]|uniref:putative mediator of RNA polymerase II transcription subunit 29 isoform X3 n=1 Tax=Teleopsis dalmanni TaxID=139649 RepID=UPI0018CE566F|nr:putative mediator of RNA polymerase II transcription subunit 29 isoform X3 [Teleopsis dalmanni]
MRPFTENLMLKLKPYPNLILENLDINEYVIVNQTKSQEYARIRALGDGSDVDNNDNTQTNTNDTDAPNDTIYMVCGVVIAMVLVGLIIILVAVTINKLRKREESSAATPATIEAQQPNFGLQNRSNSATNTNCDRHQDHQQQQTIFTTASLVQCNNANNVNNHFNNNNCNNLHNNNCNHNTNLEQQDQITFIRTNGVGPTNNSWVFPPKAPTPNIYNCSNNEALLATNDKNGFKGFRKQFSGRFKRLVAKKPEPVTVIPPELKPQLKTIYVY